MNDRRVAVPGGHHRRRGQPAQWPHSPLRIRQEAEGSVGFELPDQDHERLHLDRAFPSVRLRDDESSRGVDDAEKDANLFAAELLMPATFLKSDLAGRTTSSMRNS